MRGRDFGQDRTLATRCTQMARGWCSFAGSGTAVEWGHFWLPGRMEMLREGRGKGGYAGSGGAPGLESLRRVERTESGAEDGYRTEWIFQNRSNALAVQ